LRTQFIYLFGARIFASAAQAAVLLILARVVSVNSFGVLNSALAVGLLAASAADFGASTLLAKAQAKGDHETVTECVNFSVSSTLICVVALVAAALGVGSLPAGADQGVPSSAPATPLSPEATEPSKARP